MELNQRIDEYRAYVQNTLKVHSISKSDFFAIAVFQSLVILSREGVFKQHASGTPIVDRLTLQNHVQARFPATENQRRQEVNLYLSQRFAQAKPLEPDFIGFTLFDDDEVYSRDSDVEVGSKKEGYFLLDFDKKDQLIELLLELDLRRVYQGLTGDTLAELFNEYACRESYPTSSWYVGYQKTFNQVKNDIDISDETLHLLWYERGNSVSGLSLGALSQDEFNDAKPLLRELTQQIRAQPTIETYLKVQQAMKQAKDDGLLKKMYWALLNRTFAGIAPSCCTTTIDENSFRKVATYLNDRFALGMSLKGNWFEMNQEFKQVISSLLPEDFDPFFVNMATWHLYEDLKAGRLDKISDDSQPGYDVNLLVNNESDGTPLNQILYGPPGTGKTYHTVEAAVNAAEPAFVAGLDRTLTSDERRAALKNKYEELVIQERIRFVTFHQSYGYEEFVEGLSAKTEDGQISYYEKDGVFKSICEDAKAFRLEKVALFLIVLIFAGNLLLPI